MGKTLLFIIGGAILSGTFLLCTLSFKYHFGKQDKLVTKTSDVKHVVLGASISADKTYVSTKGNYFLTYPGSWLPQELPSQNGPGSGVPVFTTGPVSRTVQGFPSFIQIEVDSNNQTLTLEEYIKQHFDPSITFTSEIIAGEHAERTSSIQSTVPTDTILLEHGGKIYQIKWFEGAQPTIAPIEFTHVLQSFTFR